eukprot:8114468-Pyramimonas_sp.AAC.1
MARGRAGARRARWGLGPLRGRSRRQRPRADGAEPRAGGGGGGPGESGPPMQTLAARSWTLTSSGRRSTASGSTWCSPTRCARPTPTKPPPSTRAPSPSITSPISGETSSTGAQGRRGGRVGERLRGERYIYI